MYSGPQKVKQNYFRRRKVNNTHRQDTIINIRAFLVAQNYCNYCNRPYDKQRIIDVSPIVVRGETLERPGTMTSPFIWKWINLLELTMLTNALPNIRMESNLFLRNKRQKTNVVINTHRWVQDMKYFDGYVLNSMLEQGV